MNAEILEILPINIQYTSASSSTHCLVQMSYNATLRGETHNTFL